MSTRAERLTQYLWRNQNAQFQYGSHDCALFVCRWVDGELNYGLTEKLREYIGSRAMAAVLRSLRKVGGYERAVTESIGHSPSYGNDIEPGAIAVFLQDDHTEALGVASRRLVHCPGREALMSLAATRIRCHWNLECLRQ